MCLAAQLQELRARRRAIRRLVEPAILANQDLIGADDQRAGMAAADLPRGGTGTSFDMPSL
jgi:hypothetical protein